MHKRILKRGMTLALFILGLAATATAQATISTEKRALIKEMIAVTDVQKAGDLMMEAMVDQFEKSAPQRIAQSVNGMPDLTPQEREKMLREMTADNARFTKRFRELTQEKLNWSQLVEQLMYPIVDKYYTEDDLKNLIAFYKSPTGRKVLEVMPQMMAEVLVRSDELIRPKFEEISKQILEEEKKRLQE
jgi:hypothetical protein